MELQERDLRERLINHILEMREIDVQYARSAARWYHEKLPWLDLLNGIRDAIAGKENK